MNFRREEYCEKETCEVEVEKRLIKRNAPKVESLGLKALRAHDLEN